MATNTDMQALLDQLRIEFPNAAFRPTDLLGLTATELQALRSHKRLLRKIVLRLACSHPDTLDTPWLAVNTTLAVVCMEKALSQCPTGAAAELAPNVLPGQPATERFPGRQNFARPGIQVNHHTLEAANVEQ